MILSQYARNKKLSKKEYFQLKENVANTALAVIEHIKTLYQIDTGVMYDVGEILTDGELKPFIIQELKRLGVEFRMNDTLYRY